MLTPAGTGGPLSSPRRSTSPAALSLAVCASVVALTLLSATGLPPGGRASGGGGVLQEPPTDAQALLPLSVCTRCRSGKLLKAVDRLLSFNLLDAHLVRPDGSTDKRASRTLRGRLCGLCDGKAVAVVGGGPLSEAQRERVAGADTVVRFNRLGGGWRPGDRVDVLVTRHRGGGRRPFPPDEPFHLPHIPNPANTTLPPGCRAEAAAMLASVSLLLAAGNSRFDVPPSDLPKVALGAGLPAAALEGQLVILPVAQLAQRFNRWAADAVGGAASAPQQPSSGLLGILAVLSCHPASVELYGFNFSPQNWEGHSMDVEQALVAGMQRRLRRQRRKAAQLGGALPPRLLFHPPACDEMRLCDGQGSSGLPGRVCPVS